MVKTIIALILCFFLNSCVAQTVDSSACNTPVGAAYIDSCIQSPIDGTAVVGQWVTNCVTFKPSDYNVHFSFINVVSLCGPISPYNQLFLNIWDANCDSIVFNTQIDPPAWDYHILMDSSRTYILCYTWKLRCAPQTSFCPLITNSQLPVEFGYFKAEVYDDYVKLLWNTLSENNSSHFVIEKAYEEDLYLDFCGTNIVQANGTSTSEHKYSFIDKINSNERIYYRLRQVDYNGNFKYSVIISVNPSDNTVDNSSILIALPGTNISGYQGYIKVTGKKKELIFK